MFTLDDKYEELAHRINCALDVATVNDTDIEIDIYQHTYKAMKAALTGRSVRVDVWNFFRDGTFTAIELADVLAELDFIEDD